MEHPCAAERELTPQAQRREKVSKAVQEVRWQLYLLYCRTLYRPHMRLIHRFGWHWYRTRPMDGLRRCDWCGEFAPNPIKGDE